MKHLIFSICLALAVQASIGQTANNTNRHNDKNIYYEALRQYLLFRSIDSFYSKLKPIEILYVYKDSKTSDSLLDGIGKTKIEMLDDPYSFLKSRKAKEIILYSLFPLKYEDGEFSISFVPFTITIDKKRKQGLMFRNPGSYKVVFTFDGGQFKFNRVEDHGI